MMNYMDGKICGDEGTYNCKVELICNDYGNNSTSINDFEILDVFESENSVCSYNIRFQVPISCSLLYK